MLNFQNMLMILSVKKGHRRKTVLGGFTFSLYFLTMEIPMVGIPTLSISRWINPTD